MKSIFEISFPLKSELMTTVRLAAGGVCAMKGLDIDAAEDCKVCITESLLLLKHRGYLTANIFFYEGEPLSVRIVGEGEGDGTPSPEDDISLALLSALLGDVETTERDGKLHSISFEIGLK